MSAIYDLFETPSPNKEEKQPLHARIVSKGTVDKEEFLDRVHKFTGISRSLWETSDSSLHRCNVRRLKIKKKFGQRLSK